MGGWGGGKVGVQGGAQIGVPLNEGRQAETAKVVVFWLLLLFLFLGINEINRITSSWVVEVADRRLACGPSATRRFPAVAIVCWL